MIIMASKYKNKIIDETTILNDTINEFLEKLIDKKPTPGGGSVAGMVAALGQGLVMMVSHYTIGNEKYSDVQPLVLKAMELGNNYLEKFKKLIDEDIEVYQMVRDAYKLPKETEEQKVERKKTIDDALTKAMQTPMTVLEYSLKGIELINEIYTKFNINLISDLGVACKLFESSAYSAYLNILINEKSLVKDGKYVNSEYALDVCNNKIRKMSDEIFSKIAEIM